MQGQATAGTACCMPPPVCLISFYVLPFPTPFFSHFHPHLLKRKRESLSLLKWHGIWLSPLKMSENRDFKQGGKKNISLHGTGGGGHGSCLNFLPKGKASMAPPAGQEEKKGIWNHTHTHGRKTCVMLGRPCSYIIPKGMDMHTGGWAGRRREGGQGEPPPACTATPAPP